MKGTKKSHSANTSLSLPPTAGLAESKDDYEPRRKVITNTYHSFKTELTAEVGMKK